MVDAPELRSIVALAEQAANAGNYAEAEQFLRQAAVLLETQLGPRHPDLAKTLNNLGVVCETAGKAAEAEVCYRRAYAIATSALAPDDPFVITSGKNLRDFCETRGRPFELPASPPKATPRPEPPVVPTPRHSTAIAPPTPRSRGPIIGITIVGGLVLAAFVVFGMWSGSSEPSDGPPEQAAQPTPPAASPAPAATSPDPPPPIAEPPIEPALPENAPVETTPRARPPQVDASVTVAEVRLCRELSPADWRCVPATSPATPGPYFFYTRVASTRDTTVQHRWYYEGGLLRTVSLRVAANPGAGYRTYSRNTVGTERTGNWRIELRSADGALLHEERFIVR